MQTKQLWVHIYIYKETNEHAYLCACIGGARRCHWSKRATVLSALTAGYVTLTGAHRRLRLKLRPSDV